MSTRLLMIRHGETDWNRVKRIQGSLDIPLSREGQAQAERLAERMARETSSAPRLAALYSSTLGRAVQTAAPIGTALGLKVTEVPAFCERAFGEFEGCDPEQIRTRWPASHEAWHNREVDFAPAGGESLRAFYARVTNALLICLARHPKQSVAVVAHGGVLDCVYRHATGLPLSRARDFPLLNASINEIEYDGAHARIVRWGDVEHLAEMGGSEDDSSVDDSRVDVRSQAVAGG